MTCLVFAEPGDVVAVDLEDLVSEAKSAHGGGAVPGHEADEDALVDRLHPQAHLPVGVLAQDHLSKRKDPYELCGPNLPVLNWCTMVCDQIT